MTLPYSKKLKKSSQKIKIKKPSRKSLIRKLDQVFSLYIRTRDNNRCVQCGSFDNPTCGHLFSRVNYSTRWDEENAYCQCSGDNLRHEMEFEPFRRIVEARLGKEGYDALYQRHISIKKFKDYDLMEMIDLYKNKLQELAPGIGEPGV